MLRHIITAVAITALATGGSAYAVYQKQQQQLHDTEMQLATSTQELNKIDRDVKTACTILEKDAQ